MLKFLVGNKIDLVSEKQVSVQTGYSYAQQIKANFKEVSAKDNTGIVELFTDIAF